MTFSSQETSTESGQPVELYTFNSGPEVFRYITEEIDTPVDGLDYDALEIKRSDIRIGPEERDATLTLELPGSNEFAQKYIGFTPATPATVTIARYHRNDGGTPEVVTLFEGRVKAVNFDKSGGRVAKIAVEPDITAIARPVPRFTFQNLCNHVLYDDGCQVDDTLAAFRKELAVTVQDGLTLTVPGLAASGDDWFTSGFIETLSSDDARMIIDQTGDVVTLHLPFSTNRVGETMRVFAGCGHDPTTCAVKFTNFINYGGFAFVPTKNIFQTGIDPASCD